MWEEEIGLDSSEDVLCGWIEIFHLTGVNNLTGDRTDDYVSF
jgi:hypothetical protein